VIDPRGLPVLDGTRIVLTASAGYLSPDVTFTLASAATVHYVAPSSGSGGTATIWASVLGATGQATIRLNGCALPAPVVAPAAAAAPAISLPRAGEGGTVTGDTSSNAQAAGIIAAGLVAGGMFLIRVRRHGA
jgi:hypothetical protein